MNSKASVHGCFVDGSTVKYNSEQETILDVELQKSVCYRYARSKITIELTPKFDYNYFSSHKTQIEFYIFAAVQIEDARVYAEADFTNGFKVSCTIIVPKEKTTACLNSCN